MVWLLGFCGGLSRAFHELSRALAGLWLCREILLSRAYESLRRSFTNFPYKPKSGAMITRIHEMPGLNKKPPAGWRFR
jgi:hypothetical protein